jgi:hypothetical protein
MAQPTPFRSLPAARRIELVTHAARASREARAVFIQRLVARGGGFRAVTLRSWPVDRLAREIVRLNAQTDQDEIELLQLLYVELEPEIQSTFLDAAGVPHQNGAIGEETQPPYADADAVRRAAPVVKERHGEDGMRYLRTLVRYNPSAWPGIGEVVEEMA